MEHFDNFKTLGVGYLNNLYENQIVSMVKLASHAYYNGESIISDSLYDLLHNYSIIKFPNNTILKQIGAEPISSSVKLPFNMPSQNKIKPDTTALELWMAKYTGSYTVSCKLDGVSAMYVYDPSTNSKLYTRGNGSEGSDISRFIPYLKLPSHTSSFVIRGELIMKKSTFKIYESTYKNIRNLITGIIRKKIIDNKIKDVDFVAYEVISPTLSPYEQIDFLRNFNNCNIVYFQKVSHLTNTYLSDLLVEKRQSYDYEIDGLVVCHNEIHERRNQCPEHSFAFKMVLTDSVAETTVCDVIWSPSKDGYLKPRIQIEPVHLCGVRIDYATGFNAAYILNNKIGIGAIIKIVRSGEVIPHVLDIISPSDQPKMPDCEYEWNDTHVDIKLPENQMKTNTTVLEKNITKFFSDIDVENLKTGNVNKLIEHKYDSVSKILKMTESEFQSVFGPKMSTKLYNGIQQQISKVSLVKLMTASNKFGRGFSDKKLELIMNTYPDILTSSECSSDKVQMLNAIHGLADKTSEVFVSKIPEFIEFLETCGLEYKLNNINNIPSTCIVECELTGKNVVVTGTRDKHVLEYLNKVGALVKNSVSKTTYIVITNNLMNDSSKLIDAKKFNVRIIDLDTFKNTYKLIG